MGVYKDDVGDVAEISIPIQRCAECANLWIPYSQCLLYILHFPLKQNLLGTDCRFLLLFRM